MHASRTPFLAVRDPGQRLADRPSDFDALLEPPESWHRREAVQQATQV